MAKSKKKGGGSGASPPPSPQVDLGDGDDDPPDTDVVPEDAAAQIAQLQAQLGAVQRALIQAEARAKSPEAAAQGMLDGASGGPSPSIPTPSPPPVPSHAPPSEPPATPTGMKLEGNGGPAPETTETLIEHLVQKSGLPSSEVQFLVREAGRVGGSGTQSEAAMEGREDASKDTHRVSSTELQRARRLMSASAGSLYGYSTLQHSEFARGERQTAFLHEDKQNKVIARALLYQYNKAIFLLMAAQKGESREEEPNKWLKGASLLDLLHKAAAATNLLETGHKEDITDTLKACNLFVYVASRMAAVHEIVMQDIFFITNEFLSPAVVWYLRAVNYQCVEHWGMIKYENLSCRDDRMREVEEILILKKCPGGYDDASLKLSETGKDWLTIMCTSDTFTEALDKATESFRADEVLGRYYDIEPPQLQIEVARMLRLFLNLDSAKLNKTNIGQKASRDLVTMVRGAIEDLGNMQGSDLDVSLAMYRAMGVIDFQQDLVPAVGTGKPANRTNSHTGTAAAATDRGRDSTPRGGGGGGGEWSHARGRSHSRGAPRRRDVKEDCWVCYKSEHLADECPELMSEYIFPGIDGCALDVQCHNCKQIGHYKGECPGPNAIRKTREVYVKKEKEVAAASANRVSARRKKEAKKATKKSHKSSRRHPKAAAESSSESDTGTDASEVEEADTRGSWYDDSDSEDSRK